MSAWINGWLCKQYTCTKVSPTTTLSPIPLPIPIDVRPESKSVIFAWNEIVPIVAVGLLVCILVFLILNWCHKNRSSRSERVHHPGYGIPITLVEKGVANFAVQTQA
ncbi:hypothetical protein DdX_15881 [Ditylenchus destructor]|uniref:Uncharacterized protein n=1 Tax=Ditylenchus destructor TaxID=166010 RepID=A0AAD4MPL1_9BILA|nr:hypothetical protein DdX_15881 [Ditylenchus destructor]